jgi:hypothetical protein
MYPPLQSEPAEFPSASDSHAASPSGRVQGLADIPADWPPLPANASLQAEIGWVQASRLDVVEERPGGATVVHLDRADSPAPSKAAIGWLETSIRAYSKYCDIAAKATAQQEHEADAVRREKLAIAEVCSLLEEMRKGST